MTAEGAAKFGRNVRLEGARIAGLVCAVPPRKITNEHFIERFGAQSVADVVKMTGVSERYWVDATVTTSDLCFQAGEALLQRLGWKPEQVGALVYVTQTPDYRLPATACVLQARLGIGPACPAFDVNLGCSGYVYGLWIAMSLLNGGLDRVLLLVGDTISKTVDPADRSTALLFGDAGSATAIEKADSSWVTHFVLGTDGAGAHHLIIPDGGCRTDALAADTRLAERDRAALFMDGGEVFNFTLQAVPGMVKQALEHAGLGVSEVDGFLFHQANLFMLKNLARKVGVRPEQFPVNIGSFGNTSSATIPLLLTSNLSAAVRQRRLQLALSGFGVGYSWATAVLPVGPLACAETVYL